MFPDSVKCRLDRDRGLIGHASRIPQLPSDIEAISNKSALLPVGLPIVEPLNQIQAGIRASVPREQKVRATGVSRTSLPTDRRAMPTMTLSTREPKSDCGSRDLPG